MSRRRASRGFTLMEILVAFVVLATAVSVLYRTFSTSIRNVGAIAGYSEAIAIAEAKITARGLEQPLAEGEESGTTEDKRFGWQIAIHPWTAPDSTADQPGGFGSPNQLFRATVTVTSCVEKNASPSSA